MMVGREAELAVLLEAFGRAEAGEAQVAVVTGEAGILLEYDDRAGVADALGQALTTAELLGARPLADEIRTLASRARLSCRVMNPRRRATPAGSPSLSTR